MAYIKPQDAINDGVLTRSATQNSIFDALGLKADLTYVNTLVPSQSGNSGKYLYTDGSVTSWQTITFPASGANKTLSNLDSPTAINRDLIFAKTAPKLEADNTQTTKTNATLTIKAGNSIAGQRGNLNLLVCSNNTQYPLASAGLTIDADAPVTQDVATDFDFSAGTGRFFKLRVDAGNVGSKAEMWQGGQKFFNISHDGSNINQLDLLTSGSSKVQITSLVSVLTGFSQSGGGFTVNGGSYADSVIFNNSVVMTASVPWNNDSAHARIGKGGYDYGSYSTLRRPLSLDVRNYVHAGKSIDSTTQYGGTLMSRVPDQITIGSTTNSPSNSTTLVILNGVTEKSYIHIGDIVSLSGLIQTARITNISIVGTTTTLTIDTALGDGTNRSVLLVQDIFSGRMNDGTEVFRIDNLGNVNLQNLSANTLAYLNTNKNLVSFSNGSEGQVLKIVSGVPTWSTDAAGMSNPMTTAGDIIVGGSAGTPQRLGLGTVDKVLTSDGTTVSYQYAGLGGGNFGTGNVILGSAKPSGLTAANNILIGTIAWSSLGSTGFDNVLIGSYTGNDLSGSNNVAIGTWALSSNFLPNPSDNTIALGYNAGNSIDSGFPRSSQSKSVLIGTNANKSNYSDSSVVIGHNANNNQSLTRFNTTGCIVLGRDAYSDSLSNIFTAGSSSYPINTAYFGKGAKAIAGANLTNFTLTVGRALGDDQSAATGTLTLAGSCGTGTGAGGDVIVSTAPAGSSGSSLNAHVERLRVTAAGNTQLQGSLLFSADATHNIGAVNATRPNKMYLAYGLQVGGSTDKLTSSNDSSIWVVQDAGVATDPRIGGERYSSNPNAQHRVSFRRSQGTLASPSAINSGDSMGRLTWSGMGDAGSFRDSAQIIVKAFDTFTNTSSPGYIQFQVTPLNSTSLTTALQINSDSSIQALYGIQIGGAAGTSTALSANQEGSLYLISSNTSAQPRIEPRYYADNSSAFRLSFRKSRGNEASPTQALSGDELGRITLSGMGDAGSFRDSARISAVAAENITNTSSAGYLRFDTTPAGSTTLIERMRITETGEIQFKGSTSGYVGVSSPAAPTSYSLVLPSAQGAASTFLQNDGNGNLSWVAGGGGGGANTALSNLTTTAINQSLLFNPDNTYDIGADGASRPAGIHAANHVTAPTIRARDNVPGAGQHDITVRGGNGTTGNKDGGILTLAGGTKSGTGVDGDISIKTAGTERLRISHTGAIQTPNYILSPQLYDAGTKISNFSLDLGANGPCQQVTLDASNLVLTLSNPVTGGAYLLKIVQGASTGTINWASTTSIKWGTAGSPTLSNTSGKIDIINLYYDGTNYYATYALGF